MSLNVYVGKENLPSDKLFLFDADAAFMGTSLKNDGFTERVLREVEKAEYVDAGIFRDRFGRGLYSDCLSTSAKILLMVYYRPDVVVNCMELGGNATVLLLQLTEGCVFYPDASMDLGAPNVDLMINGIHCRNCDEVEWRLAEIEMEMLGGGIDERIKDQ